MYLDKTCVISRHTPTSADNDKEDYQQVATGVRINIQPASAELTAITNGAYGKTFRAFAKAVDIRVGDQLVASGVTYIVQGVQDYKWGPLPHLELVLFLAENA